MDVVVLAAAVLALIAATGCGAEGLDEGEGGGKAVRLAKFGLTDRPCRNEGEQHECVLVTGSDQFQSVREARGTRTCQSGWWTQCTLPEEGVSYGAPTTQVTQATPNGEVLATGTPPEHLLFNLDAGSCDNLNDPSCVLLQDQEGDAGLQQMSTSTTAWRLYNSYTNASVGQRSPCGTLGDCEYGTYCQNPETCLPVGAACTASTQCCGSNGPGNGTCSGGTCQGSYGCAHDKCSVGAGLAGSTAPLAPANAKTCTDPCVQKVCAQNPGCCVYAGTCSHDPCAQGNPLSCGDPGVAAVCAPTAHPSCCSFWWDNSCVGYYEAATGYTCPDPNLQWSLACVQAVHDTCDMCIPGSDTSVFAESTTRPLCNTSSEIKRTQSNCCLHDPCLTGAALTANCDADSCVAAVCNLPNMQYCCDGNNGDWDAKCVANVPAACGIACPAKEGVCTTWAPIQVDADCPGPDLVAGVGCYDAAVPPPSSTIPCGPYSCGNGLCEPNCNENSMSCPLDCPTSNAPVIPICNVGTQDTPVGESVVVNVWPSTATMPSPPTQVYPPPLPAFAFVSNGDCNSASPPCTCTLPAPSGSTAAVKNGQCVDLTCPTTRGDVILVNPPGANQIQECGKAVGGPLYGPYTNNWSENLDGSTCTQTNCPGGGVAGPTCNCPPPSTCVGGANGYCSTPTNICKGPTCSPSSSNIFNTPHRYHLTIVSERSTALGGPSASNSFSANVWANIKAGIVDFLLDPKTSVTPQAISNVPTTNVMMTGATTPHIALGVFPDNSGGDQCEASGPNSCLSPSPSTPFPATPPAPPNPMPCVGLGFSGGEAAGWYPLVVIGTTDITNAALYGAGATLDTKTLILNVNGAGNQTLTFSGGGTGSSSSEAAMLAAIDAKWPNLLAMQDGSTGKELTLSVAAGTSFVVGNGTANAALGLTNNEMGAQTPGVDPNIVLPGLPNGPLPYGLKCTSNEQCCSGQCMTSGMMAGQCTGPMGSSYCMAKYILAINQASGNMMDPGNPPYSTAMAGAIEVATNDANGLSTLVPGPGCMVDNMQNGMETDVDCGGPNCPPCAVNKKCTNNAPTNQANCIGGFCNPTGATYECQKLLGNQGPYEMVVLILGSDQTATNKFGQLINDYCNPSVEAMAGQAATALAVSNIHTSVIAIGPAQQSTATAIANAGGGLAFSFASNSNSPNSGNDVATEIAGALAQIRDFEYPCYENLPPNALFNQNNATVYYAGTTTANVQTGVPQVMNGACNGGPGWYYNATTNPSEILLCPATCTQLRNDTTLTATYTLGCPGHFSTSGVTIPAYSGYCPTEGTQVEWQAFGWQMYAPPSVPLADSANIQFQVQTGSGTPVVWGPIYNVANSSPATNNESCLIYTTPPNMPANACYANLVDILNGVDFSDAGLQNGDAVRPDLNLLVQLNPPSNGAGSPPLLQEWQLTYDCPFVQ